MEDLLDDRYSRGTSAQPSTPGVCAGATVAMMATLNERCLESIYSSMNRRRTAWLAFLAVAAIVVSFGHSWSIHRPNAKRLVVGRDSSAAIKANLTQSEKGYEPYCVPVNYVAGPTSSGPDRVGTAGR